MERLFILPSENGSSDRTITGGTRLEQAEQASQDKGELRARSGRIIATDSPLRVLRCRLETRSIDSVASGPRRFG
jgi:hypothetical protein